MCDKTNQCSSKQERNSKSRQRIQRQQDLVKDIIHKLPIPGGLTIYDKLYCLEDLVANQEVLNWEEIPFSCRLDYFQQNKFQSLKNQAQQNKEAQLLKRNNKQFQVESFVIILKIIIQQLQESSQHILRIIDFGSGSGSLVLPLAYLFPSCQFVALDMNGESIRILKERALEAGVTNIKCLANFIEDFNEPFDICLALHVCGNATDIAMIKSIQIQAIYIVAPCCIGKLKFSREQGTSFSSQTLESLKKTSTKLLVREEQQKYLKIFSLQNTLKQQQQTRQSTNKFKLDNNPPYNYSTITGRLIESDNNGKEEQAPQKLQDQNLDRDNLQNTLKINTQPQQIKQYKNCNQITSQQLIHIDNYIQYQSHSSSFKQDAIKVQEQGLNQNFVQIQELAHNGGKRCALSKNQSQSMQNYLLRHMQYVQLNQDSHITNNSNLIDKSNQNIKTNSQIINSSKGINNCKYDTNNYCIDCISSNNNLQSQDKPYNNNLNMSSCIDRNDSFKQNDVNGSNNNIEHNHIDNKGHKTTNYCSSNQDFSYVQNNKSQLMEKSNHDFNSKYDYIQNSENGVYYQKNIAGGQQQENDQLNILKHPRSQWLYENLQDPDKHFKWISRIADLSHTQESLIKAKDSEKELFPLSQLCKLHVELDRNLASEEVGYTTYLLRMFKAAQISKGDILLGVYTSNQLLIHKIQQFLNIQ